MPTPPGFESWIVRSWAAEEAYILSKEEDLIHRVLAKIGPTAKTKSRLSSVQRTVPQMRNPQRQHRVHLHLMAPIFRNLNYVEARDIFQRAPIGALSVKRIRNQIFRAFWGGWIVTENANATSSSKQKKKTLHHCLKISKSKDSFFTYVLIPNKSDSWASYIPESQAHAPAHHKVLQWQIIQNAGENLPWQISNWPTHGSILIKGSSGTENEFAGSGGTKGLTRAESD
jgi:hypothetical protein